MTIKLFPINNFKLSKTGYLHSAHGSGGGHRNAILFPFNSNIGALFIDEIKGAIKNRGSTGNNYSIQRFMSKHKIKETVIACNFVSFKGEPIIQFKCFFFFVKSLMMPLFFYFTFKEL